MTVYIDAPTWPGHGRLWSHLVSDVSYAELHDFAAGLGLPPRAFDRDHYDVIAERYELCRRGRCGAGQLPGDRRAADRGRSPPPEDLPAGHSRLTRGPLRAQRTDARIRPILGRLRARRPDGRPGTAAHQEPTLATRVGGGGGWCRRHFKESPYAACAHLVAAPLTPPPADFEPFCVDCALVGGELGASAPLPRVPARRLLRLLARPARLSARPRHRSPGDHLRRAGGALALVLRR